MTCVQIGSTHIDGFKNVKKKKMQDGSSFFFSFRNDVPTRFWYAQHTLILLSQKQ